MRKSDVRERENRAGVNVIGLLTSSTGLGAAGRATLRALDARDISHAAVDIAPGSPTAIEQMPKHTIALPSLSGLPYDVSVIQLNPDLYAAWVLRWMRKTGFRPDCTLNAIVPFWELPRLPSGWRDVLCTMDVVLAPSRFVRDAVEASVDCFNAPAILDYPQAVVAPNALVADRRRWLGDRDGTFAFLCTFDIMSEVQRKNPEAAIAAFQAAFENRNDVTLVIKVNHAHFAAQRDRYLALKRLSRSDARIVLMDETLTREDLWSLTATMDAYLSLHRAEGLGLGLMEAMAAGKPVIATGWSGNMDFMTSSNSLPVDFTIVSVSGVTHPGYVGETAQSWAEPSIEDAIRALRAVVDTPGFAAAIGARAAADMRARLEFHLREAPFSQLLDMSQSALASREHARRSRMARRYVRKQTWSPAAIAQAARVHGVRWLRRVGLKPPAPAGESPWGPPKILS